MCNFSSVTPFSVCRCGDCTEVAVFRRQFEQAAEKLNRDYFYVDKPVFQSQPVKANETLHNQNLLHTKNLALTVPKVTITSIPPVNVSDQGTDGVHQNESSPPAATSVVSEYHCDSIHHFPDDINNSRPHPQHQFLDILATAYHHAEIEGTQSLSTESDSAIRCLLIASDRQLNTAAGNVHGQAAFDWIKCHVKVDEKRHLLQIFAERTHLPLKQFDVSHWQTGWSPPKRLLTGSFETGSILVFEFPSTSQANTLEASLRRAAAVHHCSPVLSDSGGATSDCAQIYPDSSARKEKCVNLTLPHVDGTERSDSAETQSNSYMTTSDSVHEEFCPSVEKCLRDRLSPEGASDNAVEPRMGEHSPYRSSSSAHVDNLSAINSPSSDLCPVSTGGSAETTVITSHCIAAADDAERSFDPEESAIPPSNEPGSSPTFCPNSSDHTALNPATQGDNKRVEPLCHIGTSVTGGTRPSCQNATVDTSVKIEFPCQGNFPENVSQVRSSCRVSDAGCGTFLMRPSCENFPSEGPKTMSPCGTLGYEVPGEESPFEALDNENEEQSSRNNSRQCRDEHTALSSYRSSFSSRVDSFSAINHPSLDLCPVSTAGSAETTVSRPTSCCIATTDDSEHSFDLGQTSSPPSDELCITSKSCPNSSDHTALNPDDQGDSTLREPLHCVATSVAGETRPECQNDTVDSRDSMSDKDRRTYFPREGLGDEDCRENSPRESLGKKSRWAIASLLQNVVSETCETNSQCDALDIDTSRIRSPNDDLEDTYGGEGWPESRYCCDEVSGVNQYHPTTDQSSYSSNLAISSSDSITDDQCVQYYEETTKEASEEIKNDGFEEIMKETSDSSTSKVSSLSDLLTQSVSGANDTGPHSLPRPTRRRRRAVTRRRHPIQRVWGPITEEQERELERDELTRDISVVRRDDDVVGILENSVTVETDKSRVLEKVKEMFRECECYFLGQSEITFTAVLRIYKTGKKEASRTCSILYWFEEHVRSNNNIRTFFAVPTHSLETDDKGWPMQGGQAKVEFKSPDGTVRYIKLRQYSPQVVGTRRRVLYKHYNDVTFLEAVPGAAHLEIYKKCESNVIEIGSKTYVKARKPFPSCPNVPRGNGDVLRYPYCGLQGDEKTNERKTKACSVCTLLKTSRFVFVSASGCGKMGNLCHGTMGKSLLYKPEAKSTFPDCTDALCIHVLNYTTLMGESGGVWYLLHRGLAYPFGINAAWYPSKADLPRDQINQADTCYEYSVITCLREALEEADGGVAACATCRTASISSQGSCACAREDEDYGFSSDMSTLTATSDLSTLT